MSRCFLSRFLALSDIDDDGAIDDGLSESEGDDDDEASEALRDRRARVRRRDFRLFFCSDPGHCSIQKLETKLQTESKNRPCIRLQARFRSSAHTCTSKSLSHTYSKLHICTKLTSLLLLQQRTHPTLVLLLLLLILLSKLN